MTDLTDIIEIAESDTDIVPVEQNANMTIATFGDVVQSVMNVAQFQILSGRTPEEVIKRRPGKGGKTFKYIPHGWYTKKLNEAFGFHWDWELLVNATNGLTFTILPAQVVGKNDKGKDIMCPESFLVTGKLTVYIHDANDPSTIIATISKTATGEKERVPGMTWGGHIKSAEADARKRACNLLGLGLDLYWRDPDDDYEVIVPMPTLTDEQRARALSIHSDNGPKACAEYLTQALGKEITRGDLARILPELNE